MKARKTFANLGVCAGFVVPPLSVAGARASVVSRNEEMREQILGGEQRAAAKHY